MERPVIEEMTSHLPISELGEVQADHEIWEETDGGAHFKVTRHRIFTPGKEYFIVALSVSGDPMERRRVIEEFAEVFGASTAGEDVHPANDAAVDTVLWVENE